MRFKIRHKKTDAAELDVTSFMNLMIVLVPVLLLSLTFTQVRVLNVSLPDLTGGGAVSDSAQSQLEIKVTGNGFEIYYPSGVLVKKIPVLVQEGSDTRNKTTVKNLDFNSLALVMQDLKRQLSDKKEILIRFNGSVSYQDLVSTMDAVKSYRTVVAASLVEVELFPEISLGDAS